MSVPQGQPLPAPEAAGAGPEPGHCHPSQSLPGAAQPLVNCFVCLSKSSIPEIGTAALEGWGCARYLRGGVGAQLQTLPSRPQCLLAARRFSSGSSYTQHSPSSWNSCKGITTGELFLTPRKEPRLEQSSPSFPTRSRSPSWPWPRLSAAPQARASQPWLRRCL